MTQPAGNDYTFATMDPDAKAQQADEIERAARRGKNLVLAVYLVLAGAFILSSAWQITAAVFGLK